MKYNKCAMFVPATSQRLMTPIFAQFNILGMATMHLIHVIVGESWILSNEYLVDLVQDTHNCGLRMRRECRERFSATDFKGNR